MAGLNVDSNTQTYNHPSNKQPKHEPAFYVKKAALTAAGTLTGLAATGGLIYGTYLLGTRYSPTPHNVHPRDNPAKGANAGIVIGAFLTSACALASLGGTAVLGMMTHYLVTDKYPKAKALEEARPQEPSQAEEIPLSHLEYPSAIYSVPHAESPRFYN